MAPAPTLMLPRTVAPAPRTTPSAILGWRSPRSLPVPPRVTEWRMVQLAPTRAVSPMTAARSFVQRARRALRQLTNTGGVIHEESAAEVGGGVDIDGPPARRGLASRRAA